MRVPRNNHRPARIKRCCATTRRLQLRRPDNAAFSIGEAASRGLGAILLLVLVFIAPSALAASDVVAHASDDTLWVGQVLRPSDGKSVKTAMRFRLLNAADQAWRELPTVNGRVAQIAHRGQTAAVLLENGEWLLVWAEGSASGSSGPSLPRHAKML